MDSVLTSMKMPMALPNSFLFSLFFHFESNVHFGDDENLKQSFLFDFELRSSVISVLMFNFLQLIGL